MMQKRVILSFVTVAVIGLLLIVLSSIINKKPLETVSASVNIDTEKVTANFNGKIKDFKFKTYDLVKTGDVIATVEVVQLEGNCDNKNFVQTQQKQAMTEYENAAIMYKDGVITQEQYDAALAKLRKVQNQKVCGGEKAHVENIYAFKNGKIFYNTYNVGDNVQAQDILAEIEVNKPQIYAYFSPKQAKKINPDKAAASISIVKYPDRPLSGLVKSISTGDIMGNLVVIDINEDVTDLNIKNGDAAVVKISQ